jgi:hypothetical protein
MRLMSIKSRVFGQISIFGSIYVDSFSKNRTRNLFLEVLFLVASISSRSSHRPCSAKWHPPRLGPHIPKMEHMIINL